MPCLNTLRSCSFAPLDACTEHQNWLSTIPLHYGLEKKESRCKYWATRSSVCSHCSLPRTTHSLACSALLALFARSAGRTRSLPHSLRSLPHSWESELLLSQNDLVLSHSALWARTTKNTDCSTGPVARPFARTAHSFACTGLLASLAPSTARSTSKND